MKKILSAVLTCTAMLYTLLCNAQSTMITGSVIQNDNQTPLSGVTVMVKGSNDGTVTDEKGNFKIASRQKLPLTLQVTSIGYEDMEIVVVANAANVQIKLVTNTGIEIPTVRVVGFGRPTRKLQSAVTVESFGIKEMVNSAALTPYDMLPQLKGTDVVASSLLFKTVSTRGFNGSGSTRVNQIVEGMDNQAPGLNFFVGNFAGLTDLDLESMELLPGASSALYGPGGMNGTILITGKSPFKYQGLTAQGRQGFMGVDKKQRGYTSAYYDYSFRYAKAFKDKFAFKLGGQFTSATDWLANDTSNYLRAGNAGKLIPGTRDSDPNYDGVNVYGDETYVDLRKFVPPGTFPAAVPVSRTGYHEKDLIDPETRNIKLSGAVHYKFTDKLEGQVMGFWSTGNTVYTGSNRYAFKNIKIAQYKAELNHKNWFIRSYTTQEDAGEAYTATVAAQIFNEAWKPSFNPNNINGSWYPQYTGAFVGALQRGVSMAEAHKQARAFADMGRPVPGSPEFKKIFDEVRKIPIPNGGRFLETSQLWMTEGQFNFSNQVKFAEIIIGASTKKYILDSKGTLFIDTLNPIKINEAGAYAQVTKKLFNDILTLSASGRYDKNEDFKGHFSPRTTALIRIAKNNNIRVSYQTAYRFPSTQQKYIRLDVGEYTLLGGLPWVVDYMNTTKHPVFEVVNGAPSTTPYQYKAMQPENMRSFEFGYKGLLTKSFMIDAYAYFGKYTDFLGRNALYQPGTATFYSTVVNSDTKVKTQGFGLGLDYRMKSGYNIFFNVYSDVIRDVPAGFQSFFNTPEYRLNAGFNHPGIGKSKRIGFNTVLRWQDAFEWDGELANGPVKSYTTLDAQVNYKFKKIKTMLKVGGTNVFNKYYKTGYGNPSIGGLYYVSLAYNVF